MLDRLIGSRERGLPPGPPTLPIVGNLHVFPTEFPHYIFTKWTRKYGGIYSLKLGTNTMIVLTDPKFVKELTEIRNASTSDRPASHIVELVTGGFHVGLGRYGDTWRTQRKTAHAILGAQAVARLLPIQRAEATQLLYDLLSTPEGFFTHVERYSHSVIMSALYGIRSPRYDSPELTAFFRMIHEWGAIHEPGATPPIDLFPTLKLVPERFAPWKQRARRIRESQRELYFGLLDKTRERMSKGERNGCFIEVLEREEEFGFHREMTGYFAGTLMEAGSETTSSSLKTLILCLVAYPEVQQRAQAEIDRVVGAERLPSLENVQKLAYIRALILETHRFRPNLPLLMPHATTAPEMVISYMIPSGSTIFVNLWGISHNPELYDDPDNFVPERYLRSENGTKPGVDASSLKPTLPFGVGRRSCPGIHLAQNSININVMNLIWAFDFKPAVDAEGKPVKPDTKLLWLKGIATAPLPFRCTMTSRSEEKAHIILQEFLDAGDIFGKFESGLGEE
ncbi:cytochrome P450 [Roridomyces roridus]|uniref:Cytochrome P450 n=1 Tax=Roridomyces roridus TaxID=1738132 RepID=A0AAD7FW72_9AGAR|nr:cytochrome P450 [Roridomyces roridus]